MPDYKPITEDELRRMERQVRNLSMVGYDVAPITVLADQKRLIDEVRRLRAELALRDALDYQGPVQYPPKKSTPVTIVFDQEEPDHG